MKKKVELTIILPCYNVEKYIAECLDSLYAQDLPETEYEVICVNDCSPDGTRDLILKYKKKHKNLILIDHVVNKKQGEARNTGLRAAHGNYIWFVDPDDYIEKNIVSKLLNLCDNELDILIFNYTRLLPNGELITMDLTTNSKVISGEQLCLQVRNLWDLIWLPFKLFRRDFLEKNKIEFIDFNYFEDLDFVIRALCKSEKAKTLSDHVYYYRQTPNSTSSNLGINIIKGKENYMSNIYVGSRIIDISKIVVDQNLAKLLHEGGTWRINQFTKPLIKAHIAEKKIFFMLINKNKFIMNELYPYFNQSNKFIVKFSILSKSMMIVFNPFVQLLFKVKQWKR